jgi:hypothetical protein
VTSTKQPEWKQFERLVAALHHTLSPAGAEVQWDRRIEGRQFDISIRFSHFAYEYLTLIECKDSLVPVGDVEAFVTKSRRAGANKAVVVSSVGFQSGALKVAAEEGIEAFVLAESDVWPEWLKVAGEERVLAVTDVEVLASDGAVLRQFPNDPSALEYFGRMARFASPAGTASLNDIIFGRRPQWDRDIGDEPQKRQIALSPATVAFIPHVDPFAAATIRFTARHVAVLNVDTGGWDPGVLPPEFLFRNAITGEERLITETDLWLGFDTTIAAGRYYYDPFRSFIYYCEEVDGDMATCVLLESYQHGQLIQARLRMNVRGPSKLVEYTDERELVRLARMYAEYVRGDGPGSRSVTAKVGRNDPCPCGSGDKYKRCHGR